jgi:hypothetical protein
MIKNERLSGPLQKRGDNTTGIQEAINAKKEIKRMKKVMMISDGISLAKAKESIFS